jgi:seryl-tRNA synthetase
MPPGTAEIPLAGFFSNKIFEESQLSQGVLGICKASQAEPGARGAERRGLYRLQQFSEAETFTVNAPKR